jgi:hypothetical protein
MSINFRRARKGKRVGIVETTVGDKADIYVGSAFLPFHNKGVLVFTEYPVHEAIGSIELEYTLEFNSIIIWLNTIESIERLEKHLAKIKTHYEQNNLSGSRGEQ